MPLVPPDFVRPWLARPVAIFGLGVSGRGVADLVRQLGVGSVFYDRKGGEAQADFTAADAGQHQLVIFSPGFPRLHPWLSLARGAGCTCLGELDFASLFWRGSVVAVTGTNGKTTLTEFLTHALRSVGTAAVAVGNVGVPFSTVAERGVGAVAVCEVSSFQSETFQHFRSDATLWTNFDEDHLERHPGMSGYFDAKWRLIEHTAPGRIWVGTSVAAWAAKLGHKLPADAGVLTEGLPPDPRLAGTVFAEYPQRENFVLAEAFWRSTSHATEALVAAARSFKLGRHRLARVAEIDGVSYWNDSKATNFHAVHGALRRFSHPVLLIAGGRAKGGDIRSFAASLAGRVAHAFLIGETAQELAAGAQQGGVPFTHCATLREAVVRAAERARPGDSVLLSPAFASFDMFRGYDDRGSQFEAIVASLAAAGSPPSHST